MKSCECFSAVDKDGRSAHLESKVVACIDLSLVSFEPVRGDFIRYFGHVYFLGLNIRAMSV